MNKKIRKILIIVFWVVVWELISLAVNNNILLVGPIQCVNALAKGVVTASFWVTILTSLARIGLGFVSGVLVGLAFALISAKKSCFEEVLHPILTLIKSIPVASFVVLFLIWWGSARLATAISFLMVFPNIYTSTYEGIKNTDNKLLEMAKVYGMPAKIKYFYIYRPAIKPFIDSSIKVVVGLSWKSGVAAEVIGTPQFSIGERLYMSKIYLETADVLAWTAVIIILSTLFEKCVLILWDWFCNFEPDCERKLNIQEENSNKTAIEINHLNKSFGDKKVITDLSKTYEYGNTYYLREPSGSGKTSFLRLISGLDKPQKGSIILNSPNGEVAYMFQEDRLLENYSAIKNVALVNGNEVVAKSELLKILEKDDIERPVSQLSGGMKRRVALVRALSVDRNIVLLDEPFTGMDNDTRMRAEKYIEEKKDGKCLIIASHI